MRITTADALTLARFPLAAAVGAVAVAGGTGQRRVVVGLAVAAAVTDALDGWIARRSGTASARGARWDSLADVALAVALALALAALVEEWAVWALVAVGGVFVVRVAVAALRARRGLPAIPHSVLNKAAGALAFVAAVVAIATGGVANVATVAALLAALAAALGDAR